MQRIDFGTMGVYIFCFRVHVLLPLVHDSSASVRTPRVVRAAGSHVRLKKSLGQHLLRDENIARKIIGAVAPAPDDVFMEIGPGNGVLTRHLSPLVRRLTAVEIDRRMVDLLLDMPLQGNVTVKHQDFLAVDLDACAREEGTPVRIIGNIPYHITTPILFHLLEYRAHVRDATLMMQREVALRLVAVPRTKEYGILSVQFQMLSDVQMLFDVAPGAFVPPPRVVSSVVRLTPRPSPRCELRDQEFFRRLVRAVFNKRRKTLRNSIGYFLGAVPDGSALPVDLSRRPEELCLQEFAALSNSLSPGQ